MMIYKRWDKATITTNRNNLINMKETITFDELRELAVKEGIKDNKVTDTIITITVSFLLNFLLEWDKSLCLIFKIIDIPLHFPKPNSNFSISMRLAHGKLKK